MSLYTISTKPFDLGTEYKAAESHLNQLIDVVQEDISSSVSRRQYQVFVTGGIGPGVTSSLYQTIYDQDFTLQTANPICEMTVGLFYNSLFGDSSSGYDNIVSQAPGFTRDANTGKLGFAQNTLMMREKVSNYRQMAAHCLGDPDAPFMLSDANWPYNGIPAATYAADVNSTPPNSTYGVIHEALFINLRRLFVRDGIRKETFAMRLYPTASFSGFDGTNPVDSYGTAYDAASHVTYYDGKASTALTTTLTTLGSRALMTQWLPNLTGSNVSLLGHSAAATHPPFIVADLGASTNTRLASCGEVARLVRAADTTKTIGLIFYNAGMAVIDMRKAFWSDQHMLGQIDAMTDVTETVANTPPQRHALPHGKVVSKGRTIMGSTKGTAGTSSQFSNPYAKFIPDFVVSASIDNIIDHISTVRLGSSSLTAMAWQNQTEISSNIYFCRAPAAQFNYSNNPTFTIPSTGQFSTITDPTSATQRTFTFITTIGLYDSSENLCAVAKLNRPIEKNDETDLTIRVRLDF